MTKTVVALDFIIPRIMSNEWIYVLEFVLQFVDVFIC